MLEVRIKILGNFMDFLSFSSVLILNFNFSCPAKKNIFFCSEQILLIDFLMINTHFKLSKCGLYSMGKLGGKLRILLSTSLIRFVLIESVAVRFQIDSKSSGYCVDNTIPHISAPTRNCSPNMAIQTFSHARSTLCFRKRITHLPPLTFPGSSHIGLIPL